MDPHNQAIDDLYKSQMHNQVKMIALAKKPRGPNFSKDEKQILLDLIKKHRDVIENKKTDSTMIAKKTVAWRIVTEQFNALSCNQRQTDQLKNCWDNLKRYTRRAEKEGGNKPNTLLPITFQSQVEVLIDPLLDGHDIESSNTSTNSDGQFSGQKQEEQKQEESTNGIFLEIKREVDEEEEPTVNTATIRQEECSPLQEHAYAHVETYENPIPNDFLKVVQGEPEREPERMQWNGWSSAAIKTNSSEPIRRKETPWSQRKRPKPYLRDKLFQSRLDLVEIMKKTAESEAQMKQEILQEQLKQERVKTELLQLQLKQLQLQNNRNS